MKEGRSHRLTWSGGQLSLDRCHVMAILNCTPDSFFDGGLYLDIDQAYARAWQIVEEGADLLDIGAESTRPGAQAVSVDEERARLWPLLKKLSQAKYPIPISLDTAKPLLAKEALEERLVQIINDVEGLRRPEMVQVIKSCSAPVIVMHMFSNPRTMQQEYHYEDVVKDLIHFFQSRLEQHHFHCNVVVDPGIGFGKSVEHNLAILRRLREFESLGFPLMVGVSRKSFIKKTLNLDVGQCLEGSLAAAAIAVYNGASILRVHDVKPSVRVVRMVEAIRDF